MRYFKRGSQRGRDLAIRFLMNQFYIGMIFIIKSFFFRNWLPYNRLVNWSRFRNMCWVRIIWMISCVFAFFRLSSGILDMVSVDIRF